MSAPPHPLSIDLDRQTELRIRWSDQTTSVVPLAQLRRACPCAACRTQRDEAQQAGNLPVIAGGGKQADMTTADSAELVGRYGLRIHWADGHSTGVYEYGLLRRLGALSDETHQN